MGDDYLDYIAWKGGNMAEMTPAFEKKLMELIAAGSKQELVEQITAEKTLFEKMQHLTAKTLNFAQIYGGGVKASAGTHSSAGSADTFKLALHTTVPDYEKLPFLGPGYTTGGAYPAGDIEWASASKTVEFTLEKDSDEYIAKDAGFPLKAYTSSEKMNVRMIGGPHDAKVVSVKAGSEWMQWAFPAMTKTPTGEMSSSYQVRSFPVHKHDIDDTWYVLWSEMW